jgi:hypothetical protein
LGQWQFLPKVDKKFLMYIILPRKSCHQFIPLLGHPQRGGLYRSARLSVVCLSVVWGHSSCPFETWKLGNLKTLKLGNLETLKLGNLETWKLGNLEIWKLETGKLGNLETWNLKLGNFGAWELGNLVTW